MKGAEQITENENPTLGTEGQSNKWILLAVVILMALRNVSMILRHSFRLISEHFSAHRGLMDMWITAHCPVTHIPTAPTTTTAHPSHLTAVG